MTTDDRELATRHRVADALRDRAGTLEDNCRILLEDLSNLNAGIRMGAGRVELMRLWALVGKRVQDMAALLQPRPRR